MASSQIALAENSSPLTASRTILGSLFERQAARSDDHANMITALHNKAAETESRLSPLSMMLSVIGGAAEYVASLGETATGSARLISTTDLITDYRTGQVLSRGSLNRGGKVFLLWAGHRQRDFTSI